LNIHTEIDESAEATKDALQDLNATLEHLANQAGVINGMSGFVIIHVQNRTSTERPKDPCRPVHRSLSP